jgi:hypothetical protein
MTQVSEIIPEALRPEVDAALVGALALWVAWIAPHVVKLHGIVNPSLAAQTRPSRR